MTIEELKKIIEIMDYVCVLRFLGCIPTQARI